MHPDVDVDDVKTATEFELDQELAYKLLDAQQAYDEVRQYLDEVKAEVKQRCQRYDKATGTFDGEKIFDYTKREVTHIDSRRLKRDWPDIWRAYGTTKTTGYLTVTRPKAES